MSDSYIDRESLDLAADKMEEYLKELEEKDTQQQAVEQQAEKKEEQA